MRQVVGLGRTTEERNHPTDRHDHEEGQQVAKNGQCHGSPINDIKAQQYIRQCFPKVHKFHATLANANDKHDETDKPSNDRQAVDQEIKDKTFEPGQEWILRFDCSHVQSMLFLLLAQTDDSVFPQSIRKDKQEVDKTIQQMDDCIQQLLTEVLFCFRLRNLRIESRLLHNV